ncbi:hypothetical protein NV379_03640 [Paenibacillus sp. N1-5-1-14]|uniref:hypothetical protein n=1 Tax=Paenibacillus radicibacter TaxID=2972488 RepID=UPI002158C1DD|nr:hypothetical protein [Paenibacillus radicibacter]MCR8641742.1 hypothetical protein [Paenibacillus radicibacter]
MFQLSGVVGGNADVPVGAGKTKLLQQIVINVPNGRKLILREINYLLSNDQFAIKVEAQPSPGVFIGGDGFGDLTPNKVLFNNNTGDTVIIFLLISAINRSKKTLTLSRSDSWRLNLCRK